MARNNGLTAATRRRTGRNRSTRSAPSPRSGRRLRLERLEARWVLSPTIVSVTPNLAVVSDADVGTGALTLSVLFNEALNTSVAPTISFPTAGEDPTQSPATLTTDSGSWSADGKTYTAAFNVTNQDLLMPSIGVGIAGAQSACDNPMTAATVLNIFSILMNPLASTTMTITPAAWASAGLALKLGSDGNLHAYTTSTTTATGTDAVAAHMPTANVQVTAPSAPAGNLTLDTSNGDPLPTGNLTYGGGGGLTVTGGGTVTLNGANSYTGGTTVGNGVLDAVNKSAIPADSLLSVGPSGSVVLGTSPADDYTSTSPIPQGTFVFTGPAGWTIGGNPPKCSLSYDPDHALTTANASGNLVSGGLRMTLAPGQAKPGISRAWSPGVSLNNTLLRLRFYVPNASLFPDLGAGNAEVSVYFDSGGRNRTIAVFCFPYLSPTATMPYYWDAWVNTGDMALDSGTFDLSAIDAITIVFWCSTPGASLTLQSLNFYQRPKRGVVMVQIDEPYMNDATTEAAISYANSDGIPLNLALIGNWAAAGQIESWSQAQALQAAGNLCVSHSWSHPEYGANGNLDSFLADFAAMGYNMRANGLGAGSRICCIPYGCGQQPFALRLTPERDTVADLFEMGPNSGFYNSPGSNMIWSNATNCAAATYNTPNGWKAAIDDAANNQEIVDLKQEQSVAPGDLATWQTCMDYLASLVAAGKIDVITMGQYLTYNFQTGEERSNLPRLAALAGIRSTSNASSAGTTSTAATLLPGKTRSQPVFGDARPLAYLPANSPWAARQASVAAASVFAWDAAGCSREAAADWLFACFGRQPTSLAVAQTAGQPAAVRSPEPSTASGAAALAALQKARAESLGGSTLRVRAEKAATPPADTSPVAALFGLGRGVDDVLAKTQAKRLSAFPGELGY